MTEENGKLIGWQLRDPASDRIVVGRLSYLITRENGAFCIDVKKDEPFCTSDGRYRLKQTDKIGKYELVKEVVEMCLEEIS